MFSTCNFIFFIMPFMSVEIFFFFFFFQAEDGIRDLYVTGVQTCALPISLACAHARSSGAPRHSPEPGRLLSGAREGQSVLPRLRVDRRRDDGAFREERSEERRVGKECRSRGSPEHYKK